MKKILLILPMILLLTSQSKGQQHEFGVFGGVSYYIGDINPYKHFFGSKPDVGILYRYNINYRWAIRFQGSYGSLESADTKIKYIENRNLAFKSNLIEIGSQIELSYHRFQIGSTDNFTPYLFAGIAAFSFNPKAEYDNQWYELQKLNTEGQGSTEYPDRKSYKLLGLSIPFGIGVKIALGNSTVIGLEWGLRKTFTDYIDDVSTTYVNPAILSSESNNAAAYFSNPTSNHELIGYQRGNEYTKDWYSLCGITLTLKIKDKSSSCSGVSKNKGNGFKRTLKNIQNEIFPSFQ